jgi:hypothetical protein
MVEGRIPQKGQILAHQRTESHLFQEVQVIAKGLSNQIYQISGMQEKVAK